MERQPDPDKELERTGDELEERLEGVDERIGEAHTEADRLAEHDRFDDPEAEDDDDADDD